jgi:hypothetical protein
VASSVLFLLPSRSTTSWEVVLGGAVGRLPVQLLKADY